MSPSVLVDIGSAFAGGAATFGDEIDLVGDDPSAVVLVAVLAFLLVVFDAALDGKELALVAKLGNILANVIEAIQPVELAVLVAEIDSARSAETGSSSFTIREGQR